MVAKISPDLRDEVSLLGYSESAADWIRAAALLYDALRKSNVPIEVDAPLLPSKKTY